MSAHVRRIVRAVVCVITCVSLARPAAGGQDEYRIDGGDTLLVNVWKNPELSQSVVVRPDGRITLPLIRDVQAAGLTALELGKELADKFAAFINSPNVTVTVSVAAGYRVYTQGTITNGMFTLVAPITARQLLARAGGMAPEADIERAAVLRGAARIPVDLSVPGGDGDAGDDSPLLESGDILAVPVRGANLRRILVVGEVVQPHALVYQNGMTVLDAYLGAGGGTAAADLRGVKIARQQDAGEVREIPVDLEAVIKHGALRANIALAPGDIVTVPFRQPAERILVVGEVRTPKAIPYREGLTVLDAFVDAGGGTDFADLDSVKVVRAGVNGRKQEIGVDLARILKRGDLERNIVLAPGDVLTVPR